MKFDNFTSFVNSIISSGQLAFGQIDSFLLSWFQFSEDGAGSNFVLPEVLETIVACTTISSS